MVDDRHSLHREATRATSVLGSRRCRHLVATSSSRRSTRIPARSLAVCRELGRRGPGRAAPARHLLPRPLGAAEAARGGARRGGADPVRPAGRGGRAREPLPAHAASRTPTTLRASLDGALGTLVVVDKERHLLLWDGVRIHLDTRRRPRLVRRARGRRAAGVRPASPSARRSRTCRPALGIGEILTDSYSDRLLGARRAGGGRARGDGRALRAVLRASTSAPRCAPRTARSTRAPTSRTRPTRRASAPRRRRSACSSRPGARRVLEAAVIADSDAVCVPCGGCRQRLREFMPLDGRVHLCSASGERRTVTLEELLPMSFGPEFLPA